MQKSAQLASDCELEGEKKNWLMVFREQKRRLFYTLQLHCYRLLLSGLLSVVSLKDS